MATSSCTFKICMKKSMYTAEVWGSVADDNGTSRTTPEMIKKRSLFHMFLMRVSESSAWCFEALTCSRREDGLSCRHGVKPPLTHYFISITTINRCIWMNELVIWLLPCHEHVSVHRETKTNRMACLYTLYLCCKSVNLKKILPLQSPTQVPKVWIWLYIWPTSTFSYFLFFFLNLACAP